MSKCQGLVVVPDLLSVVKDIGMGYRHNKERPLLVQPSILSVML